MVRKLDKEFLSNIKNEAKSSPRKRAHLNLHSNYKEKVQRLFISLEKDSFVKPHYHNLSHQWEMFVVLEGILEIKIYSFDGVILEKFLIGSGQECQAIELEPKDIHSLKCISDNALILEIKEGPFDADNAKILLNITKEDD